MVDSKIFVTVNSQNFSLPHPSHPNFHWKDNKDDVVRETSYRPIYHCFMDHHWSNNHSLGIAGLKYPRKARKQQLNYLWIQTMRIIVLANLSSFFDHKCSTNKL